MDQWGAYSDSASGRRYNGNPPPVQPPVSRDYHGNAPGQAPAGFTYEQYQGGAGAHPQSQAQSMAASPTASTQMRDGNGDVAMSDAGDPYSGMKYAMRPHHQQPPLSGSRVGPHHSPQEPSAAAQRYSPMEALSPASPYGPPHQSQSQYGSQAAAQRQSPSKAANYTSPTSYYANRPQNQQLPPITPYSSSSSDVYPHSATVQLNAVFGNDTKSPRRHGSQIPPGPPGRGPVPQFTKVQSMTDLKPKVNAQPAFRRANPEGGFISVCTICRARRSPC
jgi:dual specificity protein kinase YAK1